MDLRTKLNAILEENAHIRVNGNRSSRRTATAAGEAARTFFNRLNEMGYRLLDPTNLGHRHIEALCKDWHARQLSPKTMQGYLSQLRIFCGWIGKPGLVKDIGTYLPSVPADELRVKAVAEKSKSWAEAGIDVIAKVKEAEGYDWRFGLMLLVQVAFGLRRMEAIQMEPWKVDEGDRFSAYETKGGRPRMIYIDTPVQRQVLDLVKSKIKRRGDTLGWMERMDGKPFKKKGAKVRSLHEASLEYSEGRYKHFMRKLGITKAVSQCTGHGLRSQFAENAALLKDIIPPTLGGTAGQMAREDLNVGRMQVSESLGHSRLSVTNAYLGSFGREGLPDEPGRAKIVIETCLRDISIDQLHAIPAERIDQCLRLAGELVSLGIYDDPRKVQLLWENHSRRFATEWLPPSPDMNLAALEAAAFSLTRSACLAEG